MFTSVEERIDRDETLEGEIRKHVNGAESDDARSEDDSPFSDAGSAIEDQRSDRRRELSRGDNGQYT